jgi:hypothetical protein
MAEADVNESIEGDDWENRPISDFQADGRRVVQFLIKSSTESGSQRIAKRARPFQRGDKLDAVGANSDDFSLEFIFHNNLDEPGLDKTLPQWPDAVEELIEQFHIGETGTLNLPWKRGIRCKATQWRRLETADDTRGGALVSVSFCTDNEDALDREAFQVVSVRAQADSAVAEASFDADSFNMFDGSIEDITQFAADLVGLMNAPNELVGTVLHAAQRLRRAVLFLKAGFETSVQGRDQMNDPESSSLREKLLALLALAGQAEGDALSAEPKTVTVSFTQTTDIWSVAVDRGVSSRLLISLNDPIPDLSYIEPGTPIKVPA